MDRELVNEAIKLVGEIDRLKNQKDYLSANASPSRRLKIEVDQCYGDFGKSFKNSEEFDGDLATDMYCAIIGLIDKRIAELEKRLSEI